MRCGNCIPEFWETCGSLSQAEAINQGCEAAIRQLLCCYSAGNGVGKIPLQSQQEVLCKLQEVLSNFLRFLAQFCVHLQVTLKFLFLHL